MDEIQAAFLRIKLKALDDDNNKRRNIAKKYENGIKNKNIKLPKYKDINGHVFHLFVIICKSRDKFIEHLNENNIGNLIHYPIPPYDQICYEDLLIDRNDFPITNSIHEQICSIPMDPTLSPESVNEVIRVINNFELD